MALACCGITGHRQRSFTLRLWFTPPNLPWRVHPIPKRSRRALALSPFSNPPPAQGRGEMLWPTEPQVLNKAAAFHRGGGFGSAAAVTQVLTPLLAAPLGSSAPLGDLPGFGVRGAALSIRAGSSVPCWGGAGAPQCQGRLALPRAQHRAARRHGLQAEERYPAPQTPLLLSSWFAGSCFQPRLL